MASFPRNESEVTRTGRSEKLRLSGHRGDENHDCWFGRSRRSVELYPLEMIGIGSTGPSYWGVPSDDHFTAVTIVRP
jgi:hypothetical protein